MYLPTRHVPHLSTHPVYPPLYTPGYTAPTAASEHVDVSAACGSEEKASPAIRSSESHARMLGSGIRTVAFTVIHDAYILKCFSLSNATNCGKDLGGIALEQGAQPGTRATR